MNRIRVIRTVLFLSLSLAGLKVLSQPAEPNNYPRNYFRNPLNIPMQLSANFGELRPNHWHMGLDIRTDARENLPVYAAAEGYIAKVGIRPQSFGRFIIINHPNGLSTLYGHLNDFNPELEKYVTDQQYKQESWAVELNFNINQFPVAKGAFIAFSGNTGGSKGPHLHFEIIDTKTDKRLNPQLFNFPMQDEIPPVLFRLAVYDRSKSVYAQSPFLYPLKKTDSGYIISPKPVVRTGLKNISFAIQAVDKMNRGGSDNGIFSAGLFLDEVPQISFTLDSIDYDETVYINSQIDYRYDYNGGAYLQHISRLPGDHCPVYKPSNGDGIIHLTDTSLHAVRIVVKDPYGNASQLNFSLLYDDSLAKKEMLPVSDPRFVPNRRNTLEREDFKLSIPEDGIYDTIPAIYFRNTPASYNAVTASYQVNDPSYPIHTDITVSIKPYKTIPAEWQSRLIMQRTGKGSTIRKVQLQNGWFTASFGDFGSFQVLADLTPPQFNDPGSYRGSKDDTINLSAVNRIVFTPTDNFGIVKNFKVELFTLQDDSTGTRQWLRFTNDKSRNWIYNFDERCPYGIHRLTATATDLAGNSTTKSWWFSRYPYTPPPPRKKAVKKSSSKKNIPVKKPVGKKKK